MTNSNDRNWHSEGKAKFQIGDAFYRPSSKLARDLGVLAAAVYKLETGRLRVLDAMTGCGVRALRYGLESEADWVWANEANLDLSSILQQNLETAIAQGKGQITHLDANRAFFDCYNRQDYYDLIDVDNFGSPAPYLSSSLWAAKINGLLYLTSTDGRIETGRLPDACLSTYGAYARSHPAVNEQGLRLLIGSVQQQAAAKSLGIVPIFSLYRGQTYRVMVRLVAKSTLTENNYGFLGYCHGCGHYQIVPWRKLGRLDCPHDAVALTLTGPMWLEALHDRAYLSRMISVAKAWGWLQQAELLEIMQAEIDLPSYYFTLGEIGRRGKMDIPKRDRLMQALQDKGYSVSLTHIDPQAIKTNADIHTCIAIALRFNFPH